jgi:uncharacterized membrane protein YdjX (TVP38/TMEM64 family)
VRLLAFALAIVALAALWHLTPLRTYTDPATFQSLIGGLSQAWFAPLAAVVLFVAGGFVLFPVVVLIAATAAALGPLAGLASSVAGVVASASLVFALGRRFGAERLQAALGPRSMRLQRRMVGHGVLTVALVRMAPIAPFSLVNAAAGAAGLRYWDFLAGTLLGMAPGLIAMSAFGAQIAELVVRPSWVNVGILAIALAGWVALAFAAQFVINWLIRRRAR